MQYAQGQKDSSKAVGAIFDVYFPSDWTGAQTALWCVMRKVGRHICWLVWGTDIFFRISVLTLDDKWWRPIALNSTFEFK
jgi:hypothetical protein